MTRVTLSHHLSQAAIQPRPRPGTEHMQRPTPSAQRARREYVKIRELGRGSFGVVSLVRSANGESLVMKEVTLAGLPSREKRAVSTKLPPYVWNACGRGPRMWASNSR